MKRQGRVLVLDDEATWRNELVTILRAHGYHAEAVERVDHALERLRSELFHVVIIDICMSASEEENADAGGLAMLEEMRQQGLNEATKVIMFSAYGTKEQMRFAFKDYGVADFLDKGDVFDRRAFLESVATTFEQHVKINLDLGINWEGSYKPEHAVKSLPGNGNGHARKAETRQRAVDELMDLLCRLFYDAESILVCPMRAGWSGMRVLRVQRFITNRGEAHEVIVKFGPITTIQQEYDNYQQHVQAFTGGARNTMLIDKRRTTHLGGIIYSLLGTASRSWMDFGSFYSQNDIPSITSAITRLFHETCGIWYANHKSLQPLNLAHFYGRQLESAPRRLEQVLSKKLSLVQWRPRLIFASLCRERSYINPLLIIEDLSFVRITYTSITHGDLNAHNVLVDSAGLLWLIDFQATGPGHILRDVATLDAVIRLQLLSARDATLEERLYMEEVLCSAEHFDQLAGLVDCFHSENAALFKAYSTVLHLRLLARSLIAQHLRDDISEYYIALLYSALISLEYSSLDPLQHEHALLSASLLVDRLSLGREQC